MKGIITRVRSSEFADELAFGWYQFFRETNGPKQQFLGAYTPGWFRVAMAYLGLEVFTYHEEGQLAGLATVLFNVDALEPGHRYPGIFIDRSSFAGRFGRFAAFAGEAYREDADEAGLVALEAAIIAAARERQLDTLIGAIPVEPLDPGWGRLLRGPTSFFLEPPFPHPVHRETQLRRFVVPLRCDGERLAAAKGELALSP